FPPEARQVANFGPWRRLSTILPRSFPMPARTRRPGDLAVEELQKLVATPQSERDLMWWHKVGEQVARFHPPGEREYGRERMPHLAKTLGGEPSANNLFKARQFAGTYTRPEVRELAKPKKS